MILIVLYLGLISNRPVIELDDLVVQGEVREPNVIEIKESRLQSKVNEAAVLSLKELEKKLLNPKLTQPKIESKGLK